TYKVTEADILAGRVINSATLEGFDEKFGNSIQDISGLTFEDDLPTETPLARPPQGIADHYEIYQGQESVFDVLINDSLGTSRLDINSIEILESPSLGRIRIENGKKIGRASCRERDEKA